MTTNIGLVAGVGSAVKHVDRCSACGHPGSDQDPLVHDVKGAGWLVHLRHYNDPGSGFYGEPYHQS